MLLPANSLSNWRTNVVNTSGFISSIRTHYTTHINSKLMKDIRHPQFTYFTSRRPIQFHYHFYHLLCLSHVPLSTKTKSSRVQWLAWGRREKPASHNSAQPTLNSKAACFFKIHYFYSLPQHGRKIYCNTPPVFLFLFLLFWILVLFLACFFFSISIQKVASKKCN